MAVIVPTLLGILKLAMAAKGKDLVGAAEQTWGLVERFTAESPKNCEGILKVALEKAFAEQKIHLKRYADDDGLELAVDDYLEELADAGTDITLKDLATWGEPEIINQMTRRLAKHLIIPGHQLDEYDLTSICRKLLDQVCAEVQRNIEADPALCSKVIRCYCEELQKQQEEVLSLLNQVLHVNTQPILEAIQRDTAEIKASTTAIREDTATIKEGTVAVKQDTEAIKDDTTAIKQDTATIKENTASIQQSLDLVAHAMQNFSATYTNYPTFAQGILADLAKHKFSDPDTRTRYINCIQAILTDLNDPGGQRLMLLLDCVRLPFTPSFALNYDLVFETAKKIIHRLAILKMSYPKLKLRFEEGQVLDLSEEVNQRAIYAYAEEEQDIRLTVVQLLRIFYRRGWTGFSVVIADNSSVFDCGGLRDGAILGNFDKLVKDIGHVEIERDLTMVADVGRCRYHCTRHLAFRSDESLTELGERVKAIVEG